MACFTYQPVLVKQNLQAIHKLIRRAREIPVEKVAERIEIQPARGREHFDEDDVHDWSKQEAAEEAVESMEKVQRRAVSRLSAILAANLDETEEKTERRKAVESKFNDPFNARTIPYELYLTSNTQAAHIIAEEQPLIQ